ncbi:lipoprotein N-acyltransferase Lnb domain-containing protein [Mangrovimonas spongiae]|uniref:DUF4105 domain-containing protein n=1 Tax=Mangrovimonas spongiae TaxID=2494697 RepID=A0A3R9MEX1_9FLAO|nr:DUF4105 domain-containing protein [Mangrovimonas spongiae]RSK40488.1 DUF4105 domain-containing protein [Mangrovimonas spongiae]
MKHRYAFILILLLTTPLVLAQTLSPKAEISVLTIGPGQALNDAFGHNAFRIKDPANGLDVTYDYGRFDFNTPNFYLKFASGKLNYAIGKSKYSDIYGFYTWQNRRVEEQKLNLTQPQKQAIYNYLVTNYKPENRYYLYDFFYDNCATKIKDVVAETLNHNLQFHAPKDFKLKTFRTLIQENLPWNSWGSLGIDIALGAVIDKTATLEEHMFLPQYINSLFGLATINADSTALVTSKQTLYTPKKTKSSSFWFIIISPIVIFSLLALIISYITYQDAKKQRRSKGLDGVIFGITGSIGILLLLLWFATNHHATANNYNLLWASPLSLIALKPLLSQTPKAWVRKYLKFLLICLALLAFHWLTGVQQFALALLPLFVALAYRYIYLIHTLKTQ